MINFRFKTGIFLISLLALSACATTKPADENANTQSTNEAPEPPSVETDDKKYSEIWPVISEIGDVPSDAALYADETGKFEKYFSEKAGKGDE